MTRSSDHYVHSICCTLFGLGLVSSLWRYGHPGLTIVLIVLVPVAALLPRWRPDDKSWRNGIRVTAAVCAGLWGAHRYHAGVTLELMLVEGVSILGFTCTTGKTQREHLYLGMVIMAQFVYGAVQPPRMAFVICTLLALPLVGALGYRHRSGLVSGEPGLPAMPGLASARIAHIVLAIVLGALTLSLFPASPGPRFGVVYVTPPVQKGAAPSIKKWFNRSPQYLHAPDGEQQVDGPDPSSLSDESSHLIQATEGKGMRGDGNGAGSPGSDLVFRVKSPTRLYMLCQLYDHYDGEEWRASNKLRNARYWPLGPHHRIPQQISVEKWVTRRLPLAYWPASLHTFDYRRTLDREAFYSFRLHDQTLPSLPFQYTGWSWLPEASEKQTWSGNLPPSHYIALPDAKISQRVRDLAAELTAGLDSPRAKALRLRDYLRDNYSYKLHAEKLPPEREAADFFLFDIKEGHCEYFASALTILARLNDLPARVAVGFSPGKYNPISGSFHVHEYHAHAWTQIFIDQHGWLTMDASPPSDLRIERASRLPFFRDPFSDDWKVQSPEEAREVAQFSRIQTTPAFTLPEWLEPPKEEAPKDRLSALMAVREQYQSKATLGQQLKAALVEIAERLKGYWELFLEELSVVLALRLFTFMIGVNMLVFLFPGMRARWRRRQRRRLCRQLRVEARASVQADAPRAVRNCYRLLRELLSLHGYDKQPGQELDAYAAGAVRLRADIASPITAVFTAYSRCEYSPFTPSAREAALVFEATERVLHDLRFE
jgi:hypothetical protein